MTDMISCRSYPKLEGLLDFLLFVYKIAWPFVVSFVLDRTTDFLYSDQTCCLAEALWYLSHPAQIVDTPQQSMLMVHGSSADILPDALSFRSWDKHN